MRILLGKFYEAKSAPARAAKSAGKGKAGSKNGPQRGRFLKTFFAEGRYQAAIASCAPP